MSAVSDGKRRLAALSPLVFTLFVPAKSEVPTQSLAEQIGAEPTPDQLIPPAEALRRVKDKDERLLTEYAWVDRKAGIVRVPIERAMDEMVRRDMR